MHVIVLPFPFRTGQTNISTKPIKFPQRTTCLSLAFPGQKCLPGIVPLPSRSSSAFSSPLLPRVTE
jgi:hypothetical protein